MPQKIKRPRFTRDEIESKIEKYVMNEKHRKLLRRRLLDHPTYERIAEEEGMDVSTIKRTIYRYKDVLGKYM